MEHGGFGIADFELRIVGALHVITLRCHLMQLVEYAFRL